MFYKKKGGGEEEEIKGVHLQLHALPPEQMRPSLRNKILKKKWRGAGEEQLGVPGHFGWSRAPTRGSVLRHLGPAPLIIGCGLFEDSLRGNKNPEMEGNGLRLVAKTRTSHLP